MMEGLDLSKVVASPSYAKAADAYKKAVATAATVTAYTVLARSMARELLPYEVRAAARWAASAVRDRLSPPPKPRRTKTIFVGRYGEGSHIENRFFWDARAYLATRIDPRRMSRLCLTTGGGAGRQLLSMMPGDSMTDVFEGVEFTWTLVSSSRSRGRGGDDDSDDYYSPASPDSLALSFDAEQTELALCRYVPFIMRATEGTRQRERALKIYMNKHRSWEGINLHHPATFDTVAMDPALKQSIVDDLNRFLSRRDYYRRIGKAWKRGYLLYGPPGTGKSSLVAAMANYLRFNIYDLDPSDAHSNDELQQLLTAMPNKAILLVEDIDCCCNTRSREGAKKQKKQAKNGNGDSDSNRTGITLSGLLNFIDGLWSTSGEEGTKEKKKRTKNGNGDSDSDDCSSDSSDEPLPPNNNSYRTGITLSGLLNFIDGLWSTSGEERIIIFTTNYKDRLDPALLRPGRMDMHIYMGYCGWEAFKTLAKNYFLIDDHALFPEIQELLSGVKVTPAEVSEMMLRNEDADIALQGFMEFLQDRKP